MPSKFDPKSSTIKWQGVDDTTPDGFSLAVGTDAVGTAYLWLFYGDRPDAEHFAGSVLIPARSEQIPVAYDRRGSFAGPVRDITDALASLAGRFAREMQQTTASVHTELNTLPDSH